MLVAARKKMWAQQQNFNYFSNWKILIDIDAVYCCFSMDGEGVSFLEKNSLQAKENIDKVLKVFIDIRMLEMILKREAHWNNIETGFHINFDRQPNFYDPALHVMFSPKNVKRD